MPRFMFTVTKVQTIANILFVVIMRGLPTSARRAALQLEGHNIHDDFAVAILKNSNTEPQNIS